MTPESDGVNDAAFRTRSKRWLAHTSEFVAPLLQVGATIASRGAPSEPKAWRKGLIIGHNHIGDVLYRTCSLEKLAELLPQCEWSYLTSPFSSELLERNPALAEVLPWNKGENSWELSDGKFGELRRREFDVVLCTNTVRHYPDLALAVALGIPNRVAFSYKGLSGLITRAAPIDFPSTYPAYFQRMVADLAGVDADWPLHPRIYPSKEDKVAAARALDNLGVTPRSPLVMCSITTRQPAGNVARSHFLAALESAHSELSFELIMAGAAEDSDDLMGAARELSFAVHVVTDPLPLLAYGALLEQCSALLTLDSGPRHLGNAAGIPVLFMRNLGQSFVETGKYCATEVDLAPPVEYLSNDNARKFIAGIPPARTAGALLDAMSGKR